YCVRPRLVGPQRSALVRVSRFDGEALACRGSGPRSGRSLLITRGAEDVLHREISFVAGVLEDRTLGALHRDLPSPRPGERLRIVDRELVEKRALIGARESLDHAQVFAGSPKVGLTGEVRRLDDERRPFPTATGVAGQTLHLPGKMRAPI